MNKEIKAQLVQHLKEIGDKKLSKTDSFPIIKVLRKVLQKNFPGVDFDTLEGFKKESETEEGKKIIGARGKSWDLILKHAEIDRIDFYVPGYTFEVTDKNGFTKEVNPVWSIGYEHPTTGSIINARFGYKMPISYKEMGQIIENSSI